MQVLSALRFPVPTVNQGTPSTLWTERDCHISWAPVAHVCNPSYSEIRKVTVQSQPRQTAHETLSQKNPSQKRAGGVAQGAERLPSKPEALSSNPSIRKQAKQNKTTKPSQYTENKKYSQKARCSQRIHWPLLKGHGSRAPWLTPVTSATWEAEIRRIAVQSQPGQIVCETLSR
jgi:hypothetical protein